LVLDGVSERSNNGYMRQCAECECERECERTLTEQHAEEKAEKTPLHLSGIQEEAIRGHPESTQSRPSTQGDSPFQRSSQDWKRDPQSKSFMTRETSSLRSHLHGPCKRPVRLQGYDVSWPVINLRQTYFHEVPGSRIPAVLFSFVMPRSQVPSIPSNVGWMDTSAGPIDIGGTRASTYAVSIKIPSISID
jgi:hypothetical protein